MYLCLRPLWFQLLTQALPAATARPHYTSLAPVQGASSSSGYCLPPLQPPPLSARGPAGVASTGVLPWHRGPHGGHLPAVPDGADSLDRSVQVAQVPLVSSRGRGDVYARMSQGLPSIETARSARLQTSRPQAQPPPTMQPQHQQHQQLYPASSQLFTARSGPKQPADNLVGSDRVGSIGLAPHTGSLAAGMSYSARPAASAMAGDQWQRPLQQQAPLLGGKVPAIAHQHTTGYWPQQQQPNQQQTGAAGHGIIDAGHLLAGHTSTTDLGAAQPHQPKVGIFSPPTAQPRPMLHQHEPEHHHAQLYSSGSITSQFAKLQSSSSCDAFSLNTAAAVGARDAAGIKREGIWQPASGEHSFYT